MRENLTEREVEILLCYADCDMQTAPTAMMLGINRKTVARAFSKIFAETGFDPTEFWDLFAIMKELQKEETR